MNDNVCSQCGKRFSGQVHRTKVDEEADLCSQQCCEGWEKYCAELAGHAVPSSSHHMADGRIFKAGPFDEEPAALEWAKRASSNGEFDINDQHVYHLTPDHRLIELSANDLK
jgi:hypothetical protein